MAITVKDVVEKAEKKAREMASEYGTLLSNPEYRAAVLETVFMAGWNAGFEDAKEKS